MAGTAGNPASIPSCDLSKAASPAMPGTDRSRERPRRESAAAHEKPRRSGADRFSGDSGIVTSDHEEVCGGQGGLVGHGREQDGR
ncbi:hypothetical protein, partial [Aureimonas leprariae]|uniref:hypothetical protein n=1 Tax=Plantimonas leprariae TaxID=2615207 RepID=UPI001AEEF57D